MRDGMTRDRRSGFTSGNEPSFLTRSRVKLVLVSSVAAGAVYAIDRERMIVGRGPGVDLAFDDPEMSRQHASIECDDGGPEVRDLDSTNGLFLNGNRVQAARLENGDRVGIGGLEFQLVIEEREQAPEVFEITADA